MARVTVEDCVEKIPNRFELVMLAAQRARTISSGARETVQRDNDKNPVVALREIADETISLDEVRETLVQGLQKHLPFDDFEEEEQPIPVIGEGVMVPVPADSQAEDEDGDEELDDEDEGADAADEAGVEAAESEDD